MAQRLANALASAAKAEGADFQRVATLYAAERVLARVDAIAPGETVLKGGFLVRQLIPGGARRTTKDLDLELVCPHTTDELQGLFQAVARRQDPDGVVIDPASVEVRTIVGQVEAGHAVSMRALVGRTPVTIPIDIGCGDAVIPAPRSTTIRSLAPAVASDLTIGAYHPATVIAEKLHGSIQGGVVNRRMKDVLDIVLLAESGPHDGQAMADAIRATFAARTTALPVGVPAAYRTERLSSDQLRTWTGFLRNNVPMSQHARSLAGTLDAAWDFLSAPVDHARIRRPFDFTWNHTDRMWRD